MDRKSLSYYQYATPLGDKNIVLIEFGRSYTRCGLANESTPRAIIKSQVFVPEINKTMPLHNISDRKMLENALRRLIEKIYFSYLAVSPKDRKVVIVESIFCKSSFRSVLTQVLFSVFDVASVLYVPDHLMALTSIGTSTGLVLDMGGCEAISIAVVDGVTLLDTAQFANLGAKALDAAIYNELTSNQPRVSRHLTPEVIENIRVRTCFVAPYERGQEIVKEKQAAEVNLEDCDFRLAKQTEKSPISIHYPVANQKTVIIPGNLRESLCEMFFEVRGYEHSIVTMITDTIMAAPLDCRKSLAESIFVVGGIANMPGFHRRLQDELKNEHNLARYKTRIPESFKFFSPLCPTNIVSWLGASIFCSTDAVNPRSTSRDEWVKDGKRSLREWSDFDINNDRLPSLNKSSKH